MEQSLSIIIAAHNAQNTIAAQVVDLLEIATDLTSQFEVLIVDDGSIDRTEEMAYELTLRYPQVHLVRHDSQLGVPAAIRTGMAHTQGDVIFVQEETTHVKPSEVRRLWSMRTDEEVMLARAEPLPGPKPLDQGLLNRLMAWGAKVTQTAREKKRAGLQMIRREAAEANMKALEFELERVEQPHSLSDHAPNFVGESQAASFTT